MIAVGSPVPEPEVYDARGAAPLPVFFDGSALLVFFRSHSEPCRELLIHIGELRVLAADLPVIGVSQETIEDTAELFQELGVSLPVVIDDRPYPASRAFDLQRLPAFALIVEDRIRFATEGLGSDLDALVSELAALAGVDRGEGELVHLAGSSPSRSSEPGRADR